MGEHRAGEIDPSRDKVRSTALWVEKAGKELGPVAHGRAVTFTWL